MNSPQPVSNLLLADVAYDITETRRGRWRRYLYPSGQLFEEFVSHAQVFGMPVLHFTRGKCPETGKRIVAKGLIAIGRMAFGVVRGWSGFLRRDCCRAIEHRRGVCAGAGCFGLVRTGATSDCHVVWRRPVPLSVMLPSVKLPTGNMCSPKIGFGEFVWDTRGVSNDAVRFFQAFLP